MHAHERRTANGRDERDFDDWDEEPEARPRRGLISRLFGLVKLALFLTPLAILAYGYFLADCRAGGGGGGIGQFLQAGVCARNELVGNAAALQDNLKLIRRIIE